MPIPTPKLIVLFIYCVREELNNGANLSEALSNAIRQCIRSNVMQEFLSRNGSEVENMLFGEWDMNEAIQVSKQEGLAMGIQIGEQRGEQRGRTEGIRETLLKSVRTLYNVLPVEQIAEGLEISVEEVNRIINIIKS